MKRLVDLGKKDRELLNWLLETAKDWEGSLTCNTDLQPLQDFQNNIANARTIIQYIFSDDAIIEADLWQAFLTMPIAHLKKLARLGSVGDVGTGSGRNLPCDDTDLIYVNGKSMTQLECYELMKQFADRALAKNTKYWVQKPTRPPLPSQTRKPSQTRLASKTGQVKKSRDRRSSQ